MTREIKSVWCEQCQCTVYLKPSGVRACECGDPIAVTLSNGQRFTITRRIPRAFADRVR